MTAFVGDWVLQCCYPTTSRASWSLCMLSSSISLWWTCDKMSWVLVVKAWNQQNFSTKSSNMSSKRNFTWFWSTQIQPTRRYLYPCEVSLKKRTPEMQDFFLLYAWFGSKACRIDSRAGMLLAKTTKSSPTSLLRSSSRFSEILKVVLSTELAMHSKYPVVFLHLSWR